MKRALCLLCCLASLAAHAAVYKSVDADGNVVYSDTPRPGAQEIILPPPPTYTPSPAPRTAPVTPPSTTGAPALYSGVQILKPAANATLRDNTGAVEVQVDTTPALNTLLGHTLVIELDGKRLTSAQATGMTLGNVERGTHTLKALIVDAREKVLGSSDSVTFYMMRESLLLHDGTDNDTETETDDSQDGQDKTPAPIRNPGNRSDNPNKLSDNPNKLSDNPNIITPPPKAPAPAP